MGGNLPRHCRESCLHAKKRGLQTRCLYIHMCHACTSSFLLCASVCAEPTISSAGACPELPFKCTRQNMACLVGRARQQPGGDAQWGALPCPAGTLNEHVMDAGCISLAQQLSCCGSVTRCPPATLCPRIQLYKGGSIEVVYAEVDSSPGAWWGH